MAGRFTDPELPEDVADAQSLGITMATTAAMLAVVGLGFLLHPELVLPELAGLWAVLLALAVCVTEREARVYGGWR